MNETLKRLRERNDVPVLSVFDEEFKTFGRVLSGYDFSPLQKYMEEKTEVPESGNVYFASVPELEAFPLKEKLEKVLFGEMPVQIGYCNGRNSTYNGFEFHKCSEINFAVTDFMLVLGHTWDIEENTYNVKKAKVFFVPKGTAVEMFQTTLHLSPCRTEDGGFRDIVVLSKGTNTPLEEKTDCADGESRLLLQKNKWVLAHPEREPLIRQGAFPGVVGENKELFY